MKRNFAKVVVYVEDCNDHSPTFLRRRYEADVSSQVPAGSELVKVKALDGDVGSNAEISYSIVTGEHQQRLSGESFQMRVDASRTQRRYAGDQRVVAAVCLSGHA